jgi:hypothetical protein
MSATKAQSHQEKIYRGSCEMFVFPEGLYRGSMVSACYKLDSGLKPAGMTTFGTYAKGAIEKSFPSFAVMWHPK